MQKHDNYEIVLDEHGNKVMRVRMTAMDGDRDGQRILHRPGAVSGDDIPEGVTAAYEQNETALANAWKHGDDAPTVPKVTGEPYEDHRLWLSNAWRSNE
ncbi:hypothetical protein [Methyloceanibacter sp. wino2]|uniref:hypothetical protein n=1 Tax=Methyloceanibacter sp. wino2 TaxID=2170729 RepID=UPI000D3EADC9|nr:hypothetical protein [Methyloceanibacter sp. wino2]